MKLPKRVGIFTAAITGGIVGAMLGLGAGVLYSVGGFFVDLFTTGLNRGTALAFGALIGMPVIFAIAGCLIGLIGAALYNLVARLVGGPDET